MRVINKTIIQEVRIYECKENLVVQFKRIILTYIIIKERLNWGKC